MAKTPQSPRWSSEDVRAYCAKHGMPALDLERTSPVASDYAPYRSRLEARYAADLEVLAKGLHIVRWHYEAIRIRLAPRTTITIDFEVVKQIKLRGGEQVYRIELHEVKGFRRDDAMAKLKIAAALHPEFSIILVTWEKISLGGCGWRWQWVPPC